LVRYLGGTMDGKLFMIAFDTSKLRDQNSVFYEYLGEISIPSSIEYIDNGYVFIASEMGDSYLISLLSENSGDPEHPYIAIKETYENLGPVLDLAMNTNEKEQTELITASGVGKNSALKFIRKGISVEVKAEVESLGNLDRIFEYRVGGESFVVLQFIDKSIGTLAWKDECLVEVETPDYFSFDGFLDVKQN